MKGNNCIEHNNKFIMTTGNCTAPWPLTSDDGHSHKNLLSRMKKIIVWVVPYWLLLAMWLQKTCNLKSCHI